MWYKIDKINSVSSARSQEWMFLADEQNDVRASIVQF